MSEIFGLIAILLLTWGMFYEAPEYHSTMETRYEGFWEGLSVEYDCINSGIDSPDKLQHENISEIAKNNPKLFGEESRFTEGVNTINYQLNFINESIFICKVPEWYVFNEFEMIVLEDWIPLLKNGTHYYQVCSEGDDSLWFIQPKSDRHLGEQCNNG